MGHYDDCYADFPVYPSNAQKIDRLSYRVIDLEREVSKLKTLNINMQQEFTSMQNQLDKINVNLNFKPRRSERLAMKHMNPNC